jgi:hypothetical protein
VPGIFNRSIFNDAIFNTAAVAVGRARQPRRRRRVIRVEEDYAVALRLPEREFQKVVIDAVRAHVRPQPQGAAVDFFRPPPAAHIDFESLVKDRRAARRLADLAARAALWEQEEFEEAVFLVYAL